MCAVASIGRPLCYHYDPILSQHRISLELGRAKNVNKNLVAEKAVQELEHQILRLDPLGGPVSHLSLAIATANLNAHIRSNGLSAREMLTQRDQFSNSQLLFQDQEQQIKPSAGTKSHTHREGQSTVRKSSSGKQYFSG